MPVEARPVPDDNDGTEEPTTPAPSSQSNSPRKVIQDPKYMHRPPRIVPNYGKKHRGLLPKSNVSRVLLYDNVTQQQMLDVKLSYLRTEQCKAGRLMDMHRKSFIVRRQQKEKQVASSIIHIDHELAELREPHNHRHHSHHHTSILRNAKQGASRSEHSKVKETDIDKHDKSDQQSSSYNHDDFAIKEEPEEGPEAGNPERPGLVMKEEQREKDARASGGGAGTESRHVEDEENDPHLHTLPSLLLQRHGASTSNGFAVHHGSDDSRSKTAGAAYRDTEHTSDVLPSATAGNLPVRSSVGGRTLVKVDSGSGLTRLLHTYPSDESTGYNTHHGHKTHRDQRRGRGKKASVVATAVDQDDPDLLMERTSQDLRYMKLEQLLVTLDQPNEGYLELSPSFHSPRQMAHFSRPTSFRHRRGSRATSASSLASKTSLSSGGSVSAKPRTLSKTTAHGPTKAGDVTRAPVVITMSS